MLSGRLLGNSSGLGEWEFMRRFPTAQGSVQQPCTQAREPLPEARGWGRALCVVMEICEKAVLVNRRGEIRLQSGGDNEWKVRQLTGSAILFRMY